MHSAAEEGTIKLYLDDFTICSCDAVVVEVSGTSEDGVVTLDQTCFYPGGGGQPCDQGRIEWEGGAMNVQRVYKEQDGVVRHTGTIEGVIPIAGEPVTCSADTAKRLYHSRLHSAGHLIDLAVERAGYAWTPGRGAHFPDMSFVEYAGEFNGENADEYRQAIQQNIDAIISEGGSVTSSRVSPEEARTRSKYIPEAVLAKYEQVHLATYNDSFDICCGGTHVQDVSVIGKVQITKVKKKDKAIRVSYTIEAD